MHMENLKYLSPYFAVRLLPGVFGFYVRKEKSLNTSNIKYLGGKKGSGDQLCQQNVSQGWGFSWFVTSEVSVLKSSTGERTSGKSKPVMNLLVRQWQKFIWDNEILPAATVRFAPSKL